MYILEYKEKISTGFFVGTAIGHTRFEENDSIQTFSITIFYPIDESKPYYMLRLKDGQVLSVANSKFTKSTNHNGEINVKYYL